MEILINSYWNGYRFVAQFSKVRIGYVTFL